MRPRPSADAAPHMWASGAWMRWGMCPATNRTQRTAAAAACHHARGTAVHAQMRELTQEVLQDLGLARFAEAAGAPGEEPSMLWGKRRLAAATPHRGIVKRETA